MEFSIKGLSGSLKLKDLASHVKELTMQNNFFFKGSYSLDLSFGHSDLPLLIVVTEAKRPKEGRVPLCQPHQGGFLDRSQVLLGQLASGE